MPILPLPQFEADLEEDRKTYAKLKPPTSIVVRFGVMKLVGEFPYSGDAKPGCGSKFVVRTHRGTELAEMLTSTCPNAGCSKSVTRKEMLEYIENSGGRDYPFFNQGKVLRLATAEDLARQAAIDESRTQMARSANLLAQTVKLPMKIVDAEPILGGERLTFYFTSEDRVDFRELVNQLASEHSARIDMRQVGARDEARLVADYEKCGQHCCCKQFLKVLKPISMKSAKIQKATLDPLKISGRCGRLMCCLRYEDETYDDLRSRLPKKKTRVKTPDGWGTVLDSQILTQLVLVRMDSNGEDIAVAVESLIKDGETPPPAPPPPGFGPPMGAGQRGGPAGPSGAGGAGRPGGPGGAGGSGDRRGGEMRGRGPDRPVRAPDVGSMRAEQRSRTPEAEEPIEQSGVEPLNAESQDFGSPEAGPSDSGTAQRGSGGQREARRPDGQGGDRPVQGSGDGAGGGEPAAGEPGSGEPRRRRRRRGRGRDRDRRGGPGEPGAPGSQSGPTDRPRGDSVQVESTGAEADGGFDDGPDDGPEERGPDGAPGAAEGGPGAGGDQPRKKRRRRRRRRGGGGPDGGAGGGGGGGPPPSSDPAGGGD